MNLRITQTEPKISIQIQSAKLNISNNNKIDFKVSHTDSKIQISATKPKLYIDQTKAFADAGLKNIEDFSAEASQLGKEAVLKYMSKKNSDGERLSKIEQGGNPSLDIIREDQIQTIDFNLGTMPQHAPEITVEPGEVKIDVIEGMVNTEYNKVPLDIRYTPYKVTYSVLQYGSVHIEYLGNNIDTKI